MTAGERTIYVSSRKKLYIYRQRCRPRFTYVKVMAPKCLHIFHGAMLIGHNHAGIEPRQAQKLELQLSPNCLLLPCPHKPPPVFFASPLHLPLRLHLLILWTMAITTKAEAEALTVEELKTELTSRGLPTEGLKVLPLDHFCFISDRLLSGEGKSQACAGVARTSTPFSFIADICRFPSVGTIEDRQNTRWCDVPKRAACFNDGRCHAIRCRCVVDFTLLLCGSSS